MKIKKIKTLEILENVFDIEVKDNNNFVCEGVVLHNSSEHVIPNGNELLNIRGMRYGEKGIRIYGDYATNEVRVFAKVADDPELKKLLLDPDSDPHIYFASKSLNKDPKNVTKAERRYCKMVTFACISKDTVLDLEDKKITVLDLYNKKDKACFTEKIKTLNRKPQNYVSKSLILDIQKTKFCKYLKRVTFEGGNFIDCTEEHHFINTNGIYKELKNLNVGDRVLGFSKTKKSVIIPTRETKFYLKHLTSDEFLYNLTHEQEEENFNKIENLNLKTIKIINIEHIPYNDYVYDLSVEKTHNYAISLSCDLSVFSGNTLYGATAEQIGNKFFNGDVKKAKELHTNFMNGFPNVKKFIKDCYEYGLMKGKIQVPFLKDFIYLNDIPYEFKKLKDEEKQEIISNIENYLSTPTKDEKERRVKNNISKTLRVSQNAPIQELASVLAGNQIFEMIKEFENTSLRIESFQHDSFTGELLIEDLPYILKHWKKIMVMRTRNRYDIPVDMDLELGIAGFKMMELKRCEVSDDLKTVVLEHPKGCCKVKKDIWGDIKNHLLKNNIKILKEEEVKRNKNSVTQDDIYSTKVAYSSETGKTFEELKLNLILDFSEVKTNNYFREILEK